MSFMKNDLHPGFRAGRTFLERFRLPPQAADERGDDDEEEEAICCSVPQRSGPAFAEGFTASSAPAAPGAPHQYVPQPPPNLYLRLLKTLRRGHMSDVLYQHRDQFCSLFKIKVSFQFTVFVHFFQKKTKGKFKIKECKLLLLDYN